MARVNVVHMIIIALLIVIIYLMLKQRTTMKIQEEDYEVNAAA